MLTRLVIHIKILFQLFRLIPNLKRKVLKDPFIVEFPSLKLESALA